MPMSTRLVCRRGGISQHSLLHQLTDEEPAVVAELVALVTELKAEGGVTEVRVCSQGSGFASRLRVLARHGADHGARGAAWQC